MQPNDDRPLPALWGNVQKVYAKMEDEATVEPIEDEEAETGLCYVGHLTNLFQGLEIPNPYYTSVMATLKAMGCVVQLRRGGGSALSKWLLLEPPTEEAFIKAEATVGSARGQRGKVNILDQRIRDLAKRVQAIEDVLKESA